MKKKKAVQILVFSWGISAFLCACLCYFSFWPPFFSFQLKCTVRVNECCAHLRKRIKNTKTHPLHLKKKKR